MITPNKLVALDESVLAKLDLILRSMTSGMQIRDLYSELSSKFSSVEEFLLTIDVLYILGRVNIDLAEESITDAS